MCDVFYYSQQHYEVESINLVTEQLWLNTLGNCPIPYS